MLSSAAREFRDALGSFATGVTVITARAADGSPVGLTANSFNSVSLDPPMVLWSLARQARSLPVFQQATHWAVHVLAAEQEALSNRFARAGEDKFAGLELDTDAAGVPLLKGCAARFSCRTAIQHEGGDHLIFVGEVTAFERSTGRAPLVFHAGRYALAAHNDPTLPQPRSARLAGSFDEDFLGYLLGRAHFQFFRQFRVHAEAQGIGDAEWFVASTLSLKAGLDEAAIDAAIAYSLGGPCGPALAALRAKGWVEQDGEGLYRLSEDGHRRALQLVAAAKALEADVLGAIGYDRGAVLKTLLRRYVASTEAGLPDLWV
ncbi:flavin reductase family protein [Pelomonas sp. KK5]|uniref:flavin reductase family protein n=1 Tax=Pelomonas sp. KK5 TaxID=1855730 RepID=UPI00097C467D|nr:flavin reductase family protein [Pelomonas sp. KK5]